MTKKFRYDPLINDVCRLDRDNSDYTDAPYGAQNGRALADLLVAVREGRSIHVARGPLGYPYEQAAVYWQSSKYGPPSAVISSCGRYQPFLDPRRENRYLLATGSTATDDGHLFDKLLSAVRYNSQVGAYRSHGMAVMAIDRQTHSNHPGVTLDEENWVTFYYDLPREIWDDFQVMEQASRELSLSLFTATWPMEQAARQSVENHLQDVKRHEYRFLTSRLADYEEAEHDIPWQPRSESERQAEPCSWCGGARAQHEHQPQLALATDPQPPAGQLI